MNREKAQGTLPVPGGLMLMTTPALAADYNFETPAPKDFYGSTSYEEVYGAQYNYGGTNAVDFLDPLADSAPGISINSGSSLEYGINSGSGSIYPDSSGSSYPIQWGDVPTLPATQFTAVSEVERNDGSIGTLVIPSLGIRYKAYDGTDSASMRKGVGTSPAQAPGRETSVCADTTGAPATTSAQSRIWKLAIPFGIRPAWGQGPMR